jgi:hypothetical protein
METLQTMWSFVSLFSIFAVPQLLGVLVYFRIRRFHRGLAHVAGFLLTTASFFCLFDFLLVYLPAKAHPDEKCGLPLMAAILMLLGGTVITIFLSLTIQVILRKRTVSILT